MPQSGQPPPNKPRRQVPSQSHFRQSATRFMQKQVWMLLQLKHTKNTTIMYIEQEDKSSIADQTVAAGDINSSDNWYFIVSGQNSSNIKIQNG